jgi:hypothetical protein
LRTLPALVLALLSTSTAPVWAADLPSGPELLDRSIRFHDPDGIWETTALEFRFDETRPDGGVRETVIAVDPNREMFSWASERNGRAVAGRLARGDCEASLDGSTEFSAEEAETYRLSCERIAWTRDYYTYLWGLPMKLRDPGTRLDDVVTEAEFMGRKVLSLRVTYDESVGGDTWYFYFDPESAALVGYRFYHDESANDGEYITTESVFTYGSMRLPNHRAWYINNGDGYLGTDTLVSLKPIVQD